MILCIASENLPGVWPCTVRGEHRVSCPDYDRFDTDGCPGCLPRLAETGFLCRGHWFKLEQAFTDWGPFRRLIVETEGRRQSERNDRIKSSTPDGYTNLSPVFIELDACDRYLRSMKGLTLQTWVHTEAGARDALRFAYAADSAYKSFQVVEKPPIKWESVRCPNPNCRLLSVKQNPTARKVGITIVTCQHCGFELDKVRDDYTPTWLGSEECEQQDHTGCRAVNCRCDCHNERKAA